MRPTPDSDEDNSTPILRADDDLDNVSFPTNAHGLSDLEYPLDEKGNMIITAKPHGGWNPNWCPATMGGSCLYENGKCRSCQREEKK